jgi:hypothetical protein
VTGLALLLGGEFENATKISYGTKHYNI